MYNNADRDSPLYSATIALALGACCKNGKGSHLLPRVGVRYGEALKRANTAIGHPSEHCNNDTLMTILLFGLIEVRNVPTSLIYVETELIFRASMLGQSPCLIGIRITMGQAPWSD